MLLVLISVFEPLLAPPSTLYHTLNTMNQDPLPLFEGLGFRVWGVQGRSWYHILKASILRQDLNPKP